MESNALEKLMNNVASRHFARSPSIRRIIKICDVVDRFLRKLFWFFLSIFSILGSMRLHRRALHILAAMDVRVIPRQFLTTPRSSFLGKGRMYLFVHLSIVFWLYTALQYQSSMSSNSLVFPTSNGISSISAAFLVYIYIYIY